MPYGAHLDRQVGVPVQHEEHLVEGTLIECQPQRSTCASEVGALVHVAHRDAPGAPVTHVLPEQVPAKPDAVDDAVDPARGQQVELVVGKRQPGDG